MNKQTGKFGSSASYLLSLKVDQVYIDAFSTLTDQLGKNYSLKHLVRALRIRLSVAVGLLLVDAVLVVGVAGLAAPNDVSLLTLPVAGLELKPRFSVLKTF